MKYKWMIDKATSILNELKIDFEQVAPNWNQQVKIKLKTETDYQEFIDTVKKSGLKGGDPMIEGVCFYSNKPEFCSLLIVWANEWLDQGYRPFADGNMVFTELISRETPTWIVGAIGMGEYHPYGFYQGSEEQVKKWAKSRNSDSVDLDLMRLTADNYAL